VLASRSDGEMDRRNLEISGGAPNADLPRTALYVGCIYRRNGVFAVQNTGHRAPRGSDAELTERRGQQRRAEYPRKPARISGAVSHPMRFIPSIRPVPPTTSS
jgi:hypothetical protein